MRKHFGLLMALTGLISSARKQGIKDVSGSKEYKQYSAYSANGFYNPTHSQRVKNKIRARQKNS